MSLREKEHSVNRNTVVELMQNFYRSSLVELSISQKDILLHITHMFIYILLYFLGVQRQVRSAQFPLTVD